MTFDRLLKVSTFLTVFIIINAPEAITDRSDRHLKAKQRVARSVDGYLQDVFEDYHLDVKSRYHRYLDTEYERNFGQHMTSYGLREYTADIFITAYWLTDKNHIEKRYLSIEIDGEDHDSHYEKSKDQGRDQFLEIVLNIPTKRIDLFDVLGIKRTKYIGKVQRVKPVPMDPMDIVNEVKPLTLLGL